MQFGGHQPSLRLLVRHQPRSSGHGPVREEGILDSEELSIDEVIRKCGLPSSAVSVALLSLEMKRLVKQLPGKLFVKNN